METITVTVKTVNGDFKKTTEVPLDMLIQDFKEQAQELANLSAVPCDLILEKTNKILRKCLNTRITIILLKRIVFF